MLVIALASLLWGTTGIAASLLAGVVSPLGIGAATMSIGGTLLFAVSARSASAVLRAPELRGWLLLGAVGVFVYPLAFYTAMAEAGIAIGNVISLGSGPIFAALLEWLFERRRPTRRWLVATALAVLGIALLAFGGISRGGVALGGTATGVPLALAAGLSYAAFTYASRRIIQTGVRSEGAVGAVFGLGAIPLAVVLVLTGAPLLGGLDRIGVIAYLAIGPMFLAYRLYGHGLRTVSSSGATTVTLLEPVTATLLAVTIAGERLGGLAWVGLLVILVGVALLAFRSSSEKAP